MWALSKRPPLVPGAVDERFSVLRQDGCWCLSGGDGAIPRAGWHDFLHRVRVEASPTVRVLARTGEMAPNALQRAQLYQLGSECNLVIAWLSDSPFVKAAVHGLNRAGGVRIQAFGLGELPQAAQFLGLGEAEANQASLHLGLDRPAYLGT